MIFKKASSISMLACLLMVLLVASCQQTSQVVKEKLPVTDGKTRLAMFEKHKAMEQSSEFMDNKWFFLGPKNTSGRMTDTAISADKSELYTASASGGVWKSTDDGDSWECVFENEITTSIGDIAVDPSDKNIVWIGTGESNIFRSSHAGCGIYKSTDGGKTWQHMGLEDTSTIARVVVHPDDSNIVYVAATGNEWTPNPDRGVYKTTDGGATWTMILQKDDLTGAVDLDMDPSDPNTLYAATWQRVRKRWNDPRTESHYTGCSIFKSTDAGESWTEISEGLPIPAHRGRIGIDIARNNPDVVYAYIDDYEVVREPTEEEKNDSYGLPSCGFIRGAQLFRSDNKGETWTRVSPLEDKILLRLCNTYGWVFGQITVDPNNEDRVYLMGVSMALSEDGGKSWERVRTSGGDNHGMWIDPEDSTYMILNNDHGVHITHDQGKTWKSSTNSCNVVQFFNVNYDMGSPFHVFGSIQDHGSRRGVVDLSQGRDNIPAVDWGRAPGGEGSNHAIDPTNPNIVYSAGFYGTISRTDISTNERTSIMPTVSAEEGPLRGQWLAGFILSPHDSNTIYHGLQYLFKSTDQGENWKRISPDLSHGDPQKLGDVKYQTIFTVSESPLKAGLIYVGTDDGRAHVTQDDGTTWTDISAGAAEDRWISQMTASKYDEGTVYMTQNGKRHDDFQVYVWKSTDYGKTWKDISANIPYGPVNVIREDPVNKEILYVGTDLAVYITTDGGKNWSVLGGNLPSVYAHDLIIHPRDNIIVVATHGRGMWAMDADPINGGITQ
jgi:photosystem II stability/assembly factor-like uncharacterized protein